MTWILALLQNKLADLKRTFLVDTWRGHGTVVELVLDASPWGLGGYLVEDWRIVSWFACGLGEEEQQILDIRTADSAAQQVVEALAVLVALRLWKKRWLHSRVNLKVKSDSISALVLCLDFKTRGKGTCILAREVALDVACNEYSPNTVQHIPGVDNVIADPLSRRYMPDAEFVLPACLMHVEEAIAPQRTRSYFRTLEQPPDSKCQMATGRAAAERS